MLHELPLVIFTIIAQMSVGSFVVLGLIHLFGARAGRGAIDKVSDPALYAIGPILVLGLLASMTHLGTPIRAINALRHLDSSWLSREILFGLLFAAVGGAFAFSQWFKWLTPRLRQVLAGLADGVPVADRPSLGLVGDPRAVLRDDLPAGLLGGRRGTGGHR